MDANGETPLFWAVRGERFDNYMFLINEGADTSIKNNDGKVIKYAPAIKKGIEMWNHGLDYYEMEGTKMKKQGDEYVDSIQGMYEYRTEKVVGNWYYYQCRWFH